MNYKLKSLLKKPLIITPAIVLLIYSVINYFTYYGTTAKFGAIISVLAIIAWLIGDYRD